MTGDLLRLAARMERERRPFALATVVRSERPTSGKPGNAALIDPEGTMHGWIGGSCTRSEVIRHALEALRLREPRLLAFGADEERPDDLVKVSMSCASGGKVEVHINPVLPAPVLLVAGDSPVALALLRLGNAMGYRTVAAASARRGRSTRSWPTSPTSAPRTSRAGWGCSRPVLPERVSSRSWPPWAARTSGRWRRSQAAAPDYLGVVASPRRMRSVRAVLSGLGLGDDAIGRIRGPAGLDLGAEQPEEIAVSILAEIVGETRRGGGGGAGEAGGAGRAPKNVARADVDGGDTGTTGTDASGRAPENVARADLAGGPGASIDSDATSAAAWATDPVCGMTVPVAGSPSAVHDGKTLHFCCEGCRGLFESTPEVFASNPATGPA